ncbi:hypothetical protein HDV63DRAFT_46295 [Trichoderma sp. SZMC 28014]
MYFVSPSIQLSHCLGQAVMGCQLSASHHRPRPATVPRNYNYILVFVLVSVLFPFQKKKIHALKIIFVSSSPSTIHSPCHAMPVKPQFFH